MELKGHLYGSEVHVSAALMGFEACMGSCCEPLQRVSGSFAALCPRTSHRESTRALAARPVVMTLHTSGAVFGAPMPR